MKNIVKENENYQVCYDNSINRLYITCVGFWQEETVTEFIQVQTNALRLVKPNYTLVADMRDYKTLPQNLVEAQKNSQQDLINAGLYKVAEILSKSVIANMQLKKITQHNDMPVNSFQTLEEGEAWLTKMSEKL